MATKFPVALQSDLADRPTAAAVDALIAAAVAEVEGYADGVATSARTAAQSYTDTRFQTIPVHVMDAQFGAKGDGVTLDWVALNAAINAAGVGGTLVFPRNRTFLVDDYIEPHEKQRWIGNGTTIKRANQRIDTTTTPIATGVTVTITVTNGAQWRVGQHVTVYDPLAPQTTFDPANHKIAAIVGNQLTLEGFFTVAFPNGGTVTTSHWIIDSSQPGVALEGFELDGNRAGNATFQRWELHTSLLCTSARGLCRDFYIHDSQADGAQIGGVGARIEDFHVVDSQGNGVHMSGASQWQARNIRVVNANLGGAAVGHADGGYIFSNQCGDGQVNGLYVENALAVIGSIDSDDNSEITFSDVVGKNCAAFIDGGSFDLSQGQIVMQGFRAYSCGTLTLNNIKSPPTAGVGPYRWKFVGGSLQDTRVSLSVARGVSFSAVDFITTTPPGDSKILLYVNDCVDIVTDRACRFIGGDYGVYVQGANTKNVAIDGQFANQYINAFRAQTPLMKGVRFQGQTRGEAAVVNAASYIPVLLSNGAVCMGADIDAEAGLYGVLMPQGGTNVTGGILRNCTIRTPVGMPSVIISGGSKNNYVTDNAYTQPIRNNQPDTNIVERNYALDVTAALDEDGIFAHANTGTATTVTYSRQNSRQAMTITGNALITLAGILKGKTLTVYLYTGVGGFTVSWAVTAMGTLRWLGGAAPVVTPTPNKIDVFEFTYDGTNVIGKIVGQNA